MWCSSANYPVCFLWSISGWWAVLGGAGSVRERFVGTPLGGGVYHTPLIELACSAAAEMQGRRCAGGSGEAGSSPGMGQLLSWLAGTGQAGEGGLLVAGIAVVRLGVSPCSKGENSAHPKCCFPRGEIFSLPTACSIGSCGSLRVY